MGAIHTHTDQVPPSLPPFLPPLPHPLTNNSSCSQRGPRGSGIIICFSAGWKWVRVGCHHSYDITARFARRACGSHAGHHYPDVCQCKRMGVNRSWGSSVASTLGFSFTHSVTLWHEATLRFDAHIYCALNASSSIN